LPFPIYQGALAETEVALLLTGSGRSRAALAVATWLSHRLRDLGLSSSAGLHAPPLLVANFGTAGAQGREVGETLLVARVREALGESYYPERLVPWKGDEVECRTVATPQREALTEERDCRALYDMEAFGVAEATATFLSTSHLVIGKCVSDQIGVDDTLNWQALASRCEIPYREGALRFLEHAREHLSALLQDSRRLAAERISAAVERLLQAARQSMPLTVTQERELAQHLKSRLARCESPDEIEGVAVWWRSKLPAHAVLDKATAKKALARLLSELTS
jgi:hypothetical protein